MSLNRPTFCTVPCLGKFLLEFKVQTGIIFEKIVIWHFHYRKFVVQSINLPIQTGTDFFEKNMDILETVCQVDVSTAAKNALAVAFGYTTMLELQNHSVPVLFRPFISYLSSFPPLPLMLSPIPSLSSPFCLPSPPMPSS